MAASSLPAAADIFALSHFRTENRIPLFLKMLRMDDRKMLMLGRCSLGLVALAGALSIAVCPARARDDVKYPDLKGEWMRLGSGSFDPGKPAGLGQKAPLTAEYQAVLEASLAEQAAGGQGNDPMWRCIPPGMPRAMIVYEGMEIAITSSSDPLLEGPSCRFRREKRARE